MSDRCDFCVERLTGVAGTQCQDCPEKNRNDASEGVQTLDDVDIEPNKDL
jgi:hypothetical protein